MEKELGIPTEDDDISCHLQDCGRGTLICKAARIESRGQTDEVEPTTCFNCEAGKIFREVGCNAVYPKINIFRVHLGNKLSSIQSLFCEMRKRNTTYEYCRTCGLVTAETTNQIILNVKGLFEAQGFQSATKDIEKAQVALREGRYDNAITRSISCLESVMRICHDKLKKKLPAKLDVTSLWKSTRTILRFDDWGNKEEMVPLMGSLSGVISHLGGLRNKLSDAHGKGLYPTQVCETIAELAINTASTVSTAIIRRFVQIRYEQDNDEKH